MKLRSKTFHVIGMIMMAMVIVLAGFSSIVLSQGYSSIEEKDCADNIQRITISLKNQESQLERNVYDWAVWDVSYQYAVDHNTEFTTNDLDSSFFTNLRVNVFAVVDINNIIVNLTFFDLQTDSKVPAPQAFLDRLVPGDPLLSSAGGITGVTGIIEIDGRPLMISTHSILTSQSEGPSHGQLMMGRYLDASEIGIIENLTGSKFTILPGNDLMINSELDHQDLSRIMNGETHVEIMNDTSLTVYYAVKVFSGQSSMVIRSEMTRDVHIQGQTTLGYLNIILIIVGLMFTLVSVLFIERFITSRVRRLDEDVAAVRDGRSFDKRVRTDGRDELSTLSVSINQMLDSLQSSEAEIHKSEDRYRMVVEDQTDLIFRIGGDMKITFANGQFCTYFGKEAGRVIGDASNLNLLPDERAGYLMKVQSLIGTDDVLTSEFNVIDRQGRERVHQWTLRGIPREKDDGEVQIVGHDITERKQTEEDLRKHRENLEELVEKRTAELLAINKVLESEIDRRNEAESDLHASEERYRDLVNNQGEGILLVDDKGKVTFSNPAADECFGVQRGKLVDLNVSGFTDDEGRKILVDEIRKAKGRSTYRWNLVRQDGGRRTLLITATQRRGLEGQHLGTFAIFRDITENDLMEQALRKREAEYRSVVEDQTDLITRLQMDGTITFVNGAFCRFFGKRTEELVGKNLDENFLENEKKALLEIVAGLNTEKPTNTREYHLRRADGKMCWIQSTFRGIFDTDGKLLEIQSVGRDISERIQMEQERLRGQRLESLGTLAGGIAHEFNNALTSIVGNVTLVRMKLMDNDPLMNRLAETESEIIRAKKLADKLLTFSKGGEPVKDVQDIRDLVPDAIDSGLVGSSSTVRVECPHEVDLVRIDKGQMVHALGNLIRNASEAMDTQGEISIRIANFSMELSKNGHPSGKYVTLSITDKGPGIATENLSKVFDPYFSTKGVGKGLGLSTALSITIRHGGWIDVETTEGQGTTFIMTLPSAQLEASDGQSSLKTVNTCSKILLMDDEESILEVGKELLEANGFTVETAKDGRAAIDLYMEAGRKGKGFDVVIMDLTIRGGMGGKEAIVELLKLDPLAVVIVSSGYSNDPVMAEHKKFGFSGVVQKPYLIRDMVEMIRSVTKSQN